MKKILEALRKGAKRTVPFLIAGASALVASDAARSFVANHPSWAVFFPVVVWLLHAVGHAKSASAV